MTNERWASIATPLEEFVNSEKNTTTLLAHEFLLQHVADVTPEEVLMVVRDLARMGLISAAPMSQRGSA